MLDNLTDVKARAKNLLTAIIGTAIIGVEEIVDSKLETELTPNSIRTFSLNPVGVNDFVYSHHDKEGTLMNTATENVDPAPTLPLVIGFRKNSKEYITDQHRQYIDHLRKNNVCEYIILDSLKELPQALSKKPQCLLFYAQGLFDQQSTIAEFMMMLKTMIHFTDPDYKIKIGFVLDDQTPFSHIKELQKAGVVGVVPSVLSWGEAETTKGFEAMLNGIPYWPKHLIDQLPGQTVKPKRETVHLTHRQKEVLELIANRGLSNKQIARVLGISESTVKIHVSAIMKAYCVRNRTQLALTRK